MLPLHSHRQLELKVCLTGSNITIPDGGTIGSVSDTDAISISSGGVVAVSATTLTQMHPMVR